MSDPTKNLPWRVEKSKNFDGMWMVVDSTGNTLFYVHECNGRNDWTPAQAEALARMVAAGSVAGELAAALKPFVAHHQYRYPFGDIERAAEALAKAAPLLDPEDKT